MEDSVSEQPPPRQVKKQFSQAEDQTPHDAPLDASLPEAIITGRARDLQYWAGETQRSLARFASFREQYYYSPAHAPFTPTARLR